VPYRRGYLLYGPPGSGKTSFTQAVAGELQLNICYLNLSGDSMDDDGLNRALNEAPSHSIILLEDIDGLFVGRESVTGASEDGRRVSFSGLLNALDGVRSQEGRIVFMTTNHREKLDPALLRPGRADFHAKLDYASYQQIVKLFVRFYPGSEALAQQFAQKLPDKKVSMAKLQGHFMRYTDAPEKALAEVKEILADVGTIEEMTAAEWLRRLGLEQYASTFSKNRLYTVNDVRHFQDEGEMEENLGISRAIHRKRIMGMINDDKLTKEDFELLTTAAAR